MQTASESINNPGGAIQSKPGGPGLAARVGFWVWLHSPFSLLNRKLLGIRRLPGNTIAIRRAGQPAVFFSTDELRRIELGCRKNDDAAIATHYVEIFLKGSSRQGRQSICIEITPEQLSRYAGNDDVQYKIASRFLSRLDRAIDRDYWRWPRRIAITAFAFLMLRIAVGAPDDPAMHAAVANQMLTMPVQPIPGMDTPQPLGAGIPLYGQDQVDAMFGVDQNGNMVFKPQVEVPKVDVPTLSCSQEK